MSQKIKKKKTAHVTEDVGVYRKAELIRASFYSVYCGSGTQDP